MCGQCKKTPLCANTDPYRFRAFAVCGTYCRECERGICNGCDQSASVAARSEGFRMCKDHTPKESSDDESEQDEKDEAAPQAKPLAEPEAKVDVAAPPVVGAGVGTVVDEDGLVWDVEP